MLSKKGILKEVITAIRDARNKNQLKPKETIKLHILAQIKLFMNQLNRFLPNR